MKSFMKTTGKTFESIPYLMLNPKHPRYSDILFTLDGVEFTTSQLRQYLPKVADRYYYAQKQIKKYFNLLETIREKQLLEVFCIYGKEEVDSTIKTFSIVDGDVSSTLTAGDGTVSLDSSKLCDRYASSPQNIFIKHNVTHETILTDQDVVNFIKSNMYTPN
ncbi:hypothetical protein A3Q56_08007 [Intoshia linei]|uniref:Uncharacterized protein n=1 Tax=Intoshia linei TaxID=1819745 RepID=A0A177AQM6_9BILA|nr:hypothetical protein A3Q56_08007 [Intoshia linei]